MLQTQSVGIFMIYLNISFHIPSSNALLATK